ncbi:MAG: hypothetical protein ACOYXB_12385 [Bacteroidota bacterium]
MPFRKGNRTLLYLAAVAVAAGLLVVLLLERGSTLRKSDRELVLDRPGRLTSFMIAGRGDTLRVVKTDTAWVRDDGEVLNRIAVENILYALSHFRITQMMEYDGQGGEDACRVSGFAGNRKILDYSLYFLKGGVWIRQPGSDRLSGVGLPGFPGLNLKKMFDPSGAYVRNHMLISILPGDIEWIAVDPYRGIPFRLEQDSLGQLRFFAGEEAGELSPDSLDEVKIRLLLSYFKGIVAEGRAEAGAGEGQEVMAVVRVKAFNSAEQVMEILPLPDGTTGESDMYTALVRLNGSPGLQRVKYIYLDVLMRGAGHYMK